MTDGPTHISIDSKAEIDRAVLNESEHGRLIASGFVTTFGDFISTEVRPILREVAAAGDDPQLLVNGLAELLRQIAQSIEFPVGTPR